MSRNDRTELHIDDHPSGTVPAAIRCLRCEYENYLRRVGPWTSEEELGQATAEYRCMSCEETAVKVVKKLAPEETPAPDSKPVSRRDWRTSKARIAS